MKKELHKYEYTLVAPESEFSPAFVRQMANRMAVSYHKYGLVAEADTDCILSIVQRLTKYRETGNTEWLVDAANFAMMEYMRNPDMFQATDSDQSPGRTRLDGTVDADRNIR